MAARFRHFDELVGKTAEGEAPACAAPFGGVERPRGHGGKEGTTRFAAPPDGLVPEGEKADPDDVLWEMTPVERVFRSFEGVGLTPYPAVLADGLEGWTRQEAIDRLEACLAAPPDLVEAVSPDPRIGVNNPALHFGEEDPSNAEARTMEKYNYPPMVMFDLARIGVGTLRHIQEPDLAWLHLLGASVPIAAPADMAGLLSADAWAVLGRFSYAVITCLFSGQQIVPLLFGYGGGSNTERRDVQIAKPSFQGEVYIPVDAGWDPWYWETADLPEPAGTYQRYALNLWALDRTTDAEYHLACSYRKCLGLLTFARVIGEYLQLLDAAIEAGTGGAKRLVDVVPAVECGNEMNMFYDLTSPETREAAAREMGRYHALLAGPIAAWGLDLRVRLGEAFCWIDDPAQWSETLEWMRLTITVGVAEELDRWLATLERPEDDPLWASLAEEIEWMWWNDWSATNVRAMVHEVGFHWYPWKDNPTDFYRPETELRLEVTGLLSEVAEHPDVLALVKTGLSWTCCVGFQGSRPSDPQNGGEFYTDNTLLHQGGMVVRRVLGAMSHPTSAPSFVTWYASMGGLTRGDIDWGLYASSGLRNVLYCDPASGVVVEPVGETPTDAGAFSCEVHAWRRPAWYALRRLAWLRARAALVESLFANADAGAMIVRLTSREGFVRPDERGASWQIGRESGRTWRYAYVCWLDQRWAAASGAAALVLTLRSRRSDWTTLPLAPTVACDAAGTTGRYGFPGVEREDWGATPQASTVTERQDPAHHWLEVEVLPADPAANPAPICVLCDHEVVEIRVRWTVGASGWTGPGIQVDTSVLSRDYAPNATKPDQREKNGKAG